MYVRVQQGKVLKMPLAELNILLKSIVYLLDILILVFHRLGLLHSVLDLIISDSQSILSLAKHLAHFVVLQYFSLVSLMVVQCLALILITESVDFSDVPLNVLQSGDRSVNIMVQVVQVVHDSVDVLVQLVVLLLKIQNPVLKDPLLETELLIVFIQLLVLSTHAIHVCMETF